MSVVLLKDPKTEVQYLIRNEHISAVEIHKSDEAVVLYLRGGQTIHLAHEPAKQFVQHMKTHMHPGSGGA
jgi:hypothetical protein